MHAPGIHSAIIPGWTMINVGILSLGALILWGFTIQGAKANREALNTLQNTFPTIKTDLEEMTSRHGGVIQILLIAVTISIAIIAFASLVQEDLLWWKVPRVHVPMALIHLSITFFGASFFLLRKLAMGRLFTICFASGQVPAISWNDEESNVYVRAGRHYIHLTAFAGFAILYLFAFWYGAAQEWNVGMLGTGFGTVTTISVLPLYVILVLGLIIQPILSQRGHLRRGRRRKLEPMANRLDTLSVQGLDAVGQVDRGITNTWAWFQFISMSYPEWPVSPAQRRFVVATTTGLLIPLIASAMRTMFG